MEEGKASKRFRTSDSHASKRRRAVYPSNISPTEWMSKVTDETLLSALSLPGTHDSAAFTHAIPFIATQRLDFRSQLDAGIRYFDLRCGLRNDTLEMVHGLHMLGLQLGDVLNVLYMWLQDHPTEALVVQLKRDRISENSTVTFAQAVVKIISARPEYWRTANTTPALGELRGKIQLLRRFGKSSLSAYGIDVTKWMDNPSQPFTIHAEHDTRITVQDHYRFTESETLPALLDKKMDEIQTLIDTAAGDSANDHWYINFTSALELGWPYSIPPKEIAHGGWWGFRRIRGINDRLATVLHTTSEKRRYGIVAMDFPESPTELISAVFLSNFERRHFDIEAFLFLANSILLALMFACVLLWIYGDAWSAIKALSFGLL